MKKAEEKVVYLKSKKWPTVGISKQKKLGELHLIPLAKKHSVEVYQKDASIVKLIREADQQ